MNKGCDLNCGSTFLHLYDAFEQGLVSEERITEACVRLFTTRYLLGLFDQTEYDEIPYTVVECPEHLKLSEKAAGEGAVLLKNNGILPLDPKKVRTLGVIGPNANSRVALVGNYHGTATEYITPLDGLLHRASEDMRILYSEGSHIQSDRVEALAFENDRISEAMIVAEESDAVILVVGLNETLEGEEGDTGNSYASGDKTDLFLPKPQMELMRAVAETGKPVILCLMAGSAIDLSFAEEHFDAVLQLWYPGARGGNVLAGIVFGDISPSGKLPDTIAYDLSDYPSTPNFGGRVKNEHQEDISSAAGTDPLSGELDIDATKKFSLDASVALNILDHNIIAEIGQDTAVETTGYTVAAALLTMRRAIRVSAASRAFTSRPAEPSPRRLRLIRMCLR